MKKKPTAETIARQPRKNKNLKLTTTRQEEPELHCEVLGIPQLKPSREELKALAKESLSDLGSSGPLIQQDADATLASSKPEDRPKMLFSMLSHFGPSALALPTAQALLKEWWAQRFDDKKFKGYLSQIGKVLSFIEKGQPRKQTDEQRAEDKRKRKRWDKKLKTLVGGYKKYREKGQDAETASQWAIADYQARQDTAHRKIDPDLIKTAKERMAQIG